MFQTHPHRVQKTKMSSSAPSIVLRLHVRHLGLVRILILVIRRPHGAHGVLRRAGRRAARGGAAAVDRVRAEAVGAGRRVLVRVGRVEALVLRVGGAHAGRRRLRRHPAAVARLRVVGLRRAVVAGGHAARVAPMRWPAAGAAGLHLRHHVGSHGGRLLVHRVVAPVRVDAGPDEEREVQDPGAQGGLAGT